MYSCLLERSFLAICLFVFAANTSATVQLDPDFDSGPGTELFAEQVLPLPDGKILLCGQFRWYDLQPAPYIIRLNENGSLDPTFQTGVVDGWIRHMEVQPDGKIVIGGAFSSVGGLARNLIARLNADGSVDPTFDPGRGFEEKVVPADPNPPYVFWHALQPDGRVLVTGSFAKFNGQTATGIARLNPDGSIDSSFEMGRGIDSWGRFVLVQPNGQILLTGWFTDYNGFSCNRMVRLNSDGTPDPMFRPFFGDKTAIYSAALLSDGKMIVAGHSKSDFHLFKREITRLNADGTEDGTFVAHTNDRTESVLIQPDGKILVCGWFSMANDTPRSGLARFHADGSVDESFQADTEYFVWNMALDGRERLLIAGGFLSVLGAKRMGVARIVASPKEPEPQIDPQPQSDKEGHTDSTPSAPPLLISSARVFSGAFELTFLTGTNRVYFLERRDRFADGAWTTIDSVEGNGVTRSLLDFAPPPLYGCYRIRMQ